MNSGVLIAINNSLNLNPKEIKCSAQAEILSIELRLPSKKKISIMTLYRVGTLGNANFKQVEKHLFDIFRSQKYKHNFIAGDSNLDSVDWHRNTASNNTHKPFLNLFSDLGLSQLVFEPTHRSGNILDILLSDSPHLVENLQVMSVGEHVNSDHSPLKFSIRTCVIKRKKMAKRTIYNYKRANWAALNNDLIRVDWDHLLNFTEVDLGWNIFKEKFTTLCDKRIPKIKIKETFKPPWFDSEVFRLNKKKKQARKLFKQTNNQQHYKKFSALRKKLKNLIKAKIRSNFDDDIAPKAITKKFWSSVKSSSKCSRIPDKMYLENTDRKDPIEIANLFNQHFYNQFSECSSYDIDIDFSHGPFMDLSFDVTTIYDILKQINPNKSQGPDNISGRVLKNCAMSISYPLTILCNICFRTGSLPDEWKTANVVPVHKKGDKNCVENYRPISLTSIVSKIFERCIRDEIYTHCRDRIHDTQHGFLPYKSCSTQLLPFSHDILLGLNSCELIDIVYFDFAKAFDSVNHDIILYKLKNQFGIDGLMLKIIKEYLKGRNQRLVINGTLSSPLAVKSGVPQGSILGPLLFVLFINDMQTKMSEKTKIALYADDTKIWRRIRTPEDHHILQSNINALNEWASLNKMKLHPEKCKILSVNNFYRNLFRELPFYFFPYQLHNTILDYTPEEKDLGVLVTSKFSFKSHQTFILNKAVTQFDILRRTCHFVNDTRKRRTLYISLVRSLSSHCSQIWSPVGPAIEPFEAFQKRCVKWIHKESFTHYNEREYIDKLKSIEILPMKYCFLRNDLLLFFKIIHEIVPIAMPPEITKFNPRTRSNSNNLYKYQLHENVMNTKRFISNSFFVRSMTQWNHLPDTIRVIANFTSFESAVDEHLWREVTRLNPIKNSDREPD